MMDIIGVIFVMRYKTKMGAKEDATVMMLYRGACGDLGQVQSLGNVNGTIT